MPQLFIILLKINLVLLLFAAAYYLILRRLTFYTLNRVFLVFGIVFSTCYPFIDLTDLFHKQQQLSQDAVAFVPGLNQQLNKLVPEQLISSNWQLLSIIFYIGVGIMALRLILQFASLYRMHRKSSPGAVANYSVRILHEEVGPFSFWQTVYINPDLHHEKELKTILAHEQVHITQWHSLDIILAELSVVFYWFNPGIWLMKKAVKENLEFITDQKILNQGIDKKTYQYSLLDAGNLNPAVAIVNNFNLSDLKKRIRMMNLKRSSKLTLSRYLLVTPVLLIVTLAFTISKKDIHKHLLPLQRVLIDTHLIEPQEQVTVNKSHKIAVKPKEIFNLSQNNTPSQTEEKDSIGKVKFFFQSVFLSTDSIRTAPHDLPSVIKERMLKENGTTANVILMKKHFAFTDSLPKEGTVEFKNVQLQLKKDDGLPRDAKTIIISSYSNKTLRDSINGESVNFFVNGKKVSAEELKKLVDPAQIKNVQISRTQNQSSNIEIRLKDEVGNYQFSTFTN